MKTKILLAFCCFTSITLFSQDSIFQLKDYKYRTQGYTALDFSMSVGGGIRDRKSLFGDTVKEKSLGMGPVWIAYTKTVSSDKRFSTSVFTAAPSYSFYSEEQNSVKTKSDNGFGYFKWELDNHFYKRKNWFWQVGNKLSGEVQFGKQSQAPVTTKNGHLTGTNELVFGFGKGRIEMVQDAQMALFILKDLKKEGLIDGQLNFDTVNDFARLITDLNTRRIFDFRRKRIYEFTKIDSFLRRRGIAASTDIRHFTIINDDWAFGYNPFRSSGSDWFFHIVPSIGISNFKTIEETSITRSALKTYNTELGAGPETGYENFKPINLKWQRNIRSSLSWKFYKNLGVLRSTANGTTTKTKGSSYYNNGTFYFLYGLDYYPNNRTRVNSSFDLTTDFDQSRFSIKPSLYFSTDYFVSYRTRLEIYLTSLYQYDEIKYLGMPTSRTHNLDISFGIGISHAFL